MVPDTWENQQQNVLISQMERSRDRAAAAVSVKKGEGQDCRSWTSEGQCVRDKGSFEHNPTKKRKGKEPTSRSPARRNKSPELQNTKKAGRSPSGTEDRPPSPKSRDNSRDTASRYETATIAHANISHKSSVQKYLKIGGFAWRLFSTTGRNSSNNGNLMGQV